MKIKLWPFNRKSRLQKILEGSIKDTRPKWLIKLEDQWGATVGKYLLYPLSRFYDDHLGNFLHRINKVLDYLPILWYDYDWDYVYFYVILKKKIDRMIPVFKEGHLKGSDQTVKELKICSHILDRLINDIYSKERCEKSFKKYGSLQWVTASGTVHDSPEAQTPYNLVYERHHERAVKEVRRLHKRADIRKKEDLALLCNIIRRKSQTWWD